MQPIGLLRALRRLAPSRWPSRWRRGGASHVQGTVSNGTPEVNSAVTAVMVGDTCRAVRLEQRVGSDRLQLTQAGSGSGDQLRVWNAAGWFDDAQVVLVLGSEDRHFLTLDRPELPPEELALAARYPLAEALETEADTLLVTATPMPLTNDALRPQMLAVAARLGPVRQQLAQLSAAGIRARHIDIADSALRGMVLLQGQAQEGCVALAFVGADICIGLIWQHQFCALRVLPLPPRTPRDEAEFEEQLALHIQRTADYFERQATRLAVRSVLACMPALSGDACRNVLSSLPLVARTFDLEAALAVNDGAARACKDNNDLTALVGVAAARLLEPLAEQAATQAQAHEDASREAERAGGFEPLGLAPLPSALSLPAADPFKTAPTPAALSQSAIEQAAWASSSADLRAPGGAYEAPNPFASPGLGMTASTGSAEMELESRS